MIVLILTIVMTLQGFVMQQSLEAWSDPFDYTEAIYVHAPDGACDVSLDRDTGVIKITLCEI
jgi:hypothetical protein